MLFLSQLTRRNEELVQEERLHKHPKLLDSSTCYDIACSSTSPHSPIQSHPSHVFFAGLGIELVVKGKERGAECSVDSGEAVGQAGADFELSFPHPSLFHASSCANFPNKGKEECQTLSFLCQAFCPLPD
jgi:hypothetical protein